MSSGETETISFAARVTKAKMQHAQTRMRNQRAKEQTPDLL